MRGLIEYYIQETGEIPNFVGLALSSRKNMCVHPQVGCLHLQLNIEFWMVLLYHEQQADIRVDGDTTKLLRLQEVTQVYLIIFS